ncbi:DUF1569 domain-containing protein [Niabella beijingensis]|uniref:DUF1569 domain-containing protein n=1 Tax=Niabella beijingensis TaxID=2872700 RepID=UPI001CBD808C|nr:DUF1569 domain-containing protein [Niabella beijingensis]MBZ4188574.1 DUF1569 domain-containing protein [Niabella beijingensis]
MTNIFSQEGAQFMISRIEQLTPESQPHWGKMSVDQMLAHLCVMYETVYTDKHPKPAGFLKWMMKTFIKKTVVNASPYKRNGRTAPHFRIAGPRDFEKEKQRLMGYIRQTRELGAAHFDGKESHSFGPLSETEWNNLFSKHLDHHLKQFGV